MSFTKALALDEGVNEVRVNCISVGAIDTALLRKSAERMPISYFEDISVFYPSLHHFIYYLFSYVAYLPLLLANYSSPSYTLQ